MFDPQIPLVDSPAQSVSRRDAAIAVVGDLAFRLRPARMEVADADRVDCGSDQLFLASAIRCELGPRPFFSRTAHRAGTGCIVLGYLIVVPAAVYFPTHRFLVWLTQRWRTKS